MVFYGILYVIEKKVLLLLATKWQNLTSIILSEGSQTPKKCKVHLFKNSKNMKDIKLYLEKFSAIQNIFVIVLRYI